MNSVSFLARVSQKRRGALSLWHQLAHDVCSSIGDVNLVHLIKVLSAKGEIV